MCVLSIQILKNCLESQALAKKPPYLTKLKFHQEGHYFLLDRRSEKSHSSKSQSSQVRKSTDLCTRVFLLFSRFFRIIRTEFGAAFRRWSIFNFSIFARKSFSPFAKNSSLASRKFTPHLRTSSIEFWRVVRLVRSVENISALPWLCDGPSSECFSSNKQTPRSSPICQCRNESLFFTIFLPLFPSATN